MVNHRVERADVLALLFGLMKKDKELLGYWVEAGKLGQF